METWVWHWNYRFAVQWVNNATSGDVVGGCWRCWRWSGPHDGPRECICNAGEDPGRTHLTKPTGSYWIYTLYLQRSFSTTRVHLEGSQWLRQHPNRINSQLPDDTSTSIVTHLLSQTKDLSLFFSSYFSNVDSLCSNFNEWLVGSIVNLLII